MELCGSVMVEFNIGMSGVFFGGVYSVSIN